jgi:hypothetical protein
MFTNEWTKIMNQISNFQGGNFNTWFRGHNDADFKLNSGLYREKLKKPGDYIATENSYYNLFKRMGYVHHREDDSWKLLFLMQHYGVKTRLLDWSESFAVALYFAYEGWTKNKNAAVWLLDPLALNEKILKKKVFFTPRNSYEDLISSTKFNDNSLAIYPMRNSSRINSQHGMFTIQGKFGIPLEDEFNGKLFEEGVLQKVEITEDLREDVIKYLKLVGINDFTLFPELEGLAKYINKRGYFKKRETNQIKELEMIK